MANISPPTRIVCCVTNDLSYDQRMIRICRSLQEAGYQVTLVGRQKPESVPLIARNFAQQRIHCPIRRGWLFYAVFNLQLFWKLLSSRADIICAVDLDTLLPAFLAAKIKRSKLVYDAHEYFTEVPELVNRPLVQRIWSVLANWLIPKADLAYTVGPALADIFERKYRKAFGVVRNLPLSGKTHPDPPQAHPTPILLYQGMLNEGRGLEAIIDTLPLLPGQVILWLAGEGDRSASLREQVAAAGLQHRVIFHGLLAPEALRQLSAKAAIGLNLLENKGLNYYYSLANKAFDYIQAGIPSLQMQFPEYERLQEQWGVFRLVPDLSPDTLAAAIRDLLDDPEQWEALRRNCLLAAKTLCWENEVPVLLELYRGLSAPRKKPLHRQDNLNKSNTHKGQ